MRSDCRLTGESGEWRRRQALALKKAGWLQHDIATALGITEGAVSQWMTAVRRGGPDALCSRRSSGRVPRLSVAQLRLIPDFLWHGAEAYGFRGEVWTCPRVAEVLKLEFGIRFCRSQVSRILKRLEWSPQIPITRAIQRDEDAIVYWHTEVWPKLRQRACNERRIIVFVDESGFYLLPGVVRTYAPRGMTPVLREWQTRDHLSIVGGVTPEGKVYTLVRQQSLNGLHMIEFLEHLLRVAGQRLLVIWDGSPIHRRKEVKDFLGATGLGTSIHLERLPPYAPDLNPCEWAWRHLKYVELRNTTCMDLEELHLELHLAIGRLRRRPKLIQSFYTDAGLVH